MPHVLSGDVRIHYRVLGEGEPVMLIHGYSASGRTNWEATGWFETLAPYYRVIVPDLRGHGLSEKPHRATAYSVGLMAADVLACLEAEAGRDAVRIIGYSMGGMVTMELLLNHPEKVEAAVIGGMGSRFPRRGDRGQARRQQLELESPPPVASRGGRGFLPPTCGTLIPSH